MIPCATSTSFSGKRRWSDPHILFVQGCVQAGVHRTLHKNFPLYISIYPLCVRGVRVNEKVEEKDLYGYRTHEHPARPAQQLTGITPRLAFASAVCGAALHRTHGGRG